MYGILLKLATWLLQKLVVAGLIAAVALAGYGVWLYLQDEGAMEVDRIGRLENARKAREQLFAAQAAVAERISTIQAEMAVQQDRAKRAADIVAKLRQLQSWWESVFGNSVQQAANAEQIERMTALKSTASAKFLELQQSAALVLREKDNVELALIRVNAEVAQLEQGQSRPRHYLLVAWDETKWWIALALGSYFVGPTLWSLMMYYVVGGLLALGRPIRLGPEPSALPEVSLSRVSVAVTLEPGELLRVKENFLQASDEGVLRRTRFVLDWRIPLTSLACGLIELIELRHPQAEGEGSYRVTLSNGEDPHIELAIVTVPAGGSLVLRPSFLAGVVQRQSERLVIRRHWRIFRWQAWISGQFRFFEFVGPCRLVVSGSRGVRAELLVPREGQLPPARRTNQDATIGFTPNLSYSPVRAETFWSYYRGMNPLFDDRFAGHGLFVLQETASEGPGAKAGKFWATLWSGVLKVFGL